MEVHLQSMGQIARLCGYVWVKRRPYTKLVNLHMYMCNSTEAKQHIYEPTLCQLSMKLGGGGVLLQLHSQPIAFLSPFILTFANNNSLRMLDSYAVVVIPWCHHIHTLS